jgi:hypothetical protein
MKKWIVLIFPDGELRNENELGVKSPDDPANVEP